MFKLFIHNIPPRVFWLANILFWLILNTLAADNTHKTRLLYERPSIWVETWLEYLPWWGNWAIVAPFTIAAVRTISGKSRRLTQHILLHLTTVTVMMFIYWGLTLVEVWFFNNQGQYDIDNLVSAFFRLLYSPMHMDVLVYLSIAGMGLAQSYYAKSQEFAIQSQRLSNQLLKAELNALKAQLNPHFLFNTLNTISGLVRLDQKNSAVQALSELSQMFRNVLENQNQQLTSLKNEMDFIESYLAIQKLRFENKIAMQLQVAKECLEYQLPFMLLHTLVENAVQHGSQLESDQNLMRLNVSCADGRLYVDLVNKASKRDDHKGFGIGLKNCQKRLKHIYQNDYSLSCLEIENGYFQTKLCIPIGHADV